MLPTEPQKCKSHGIKTRILNIVFAKCQFYLTKILLYLLIYLILNVNHLQSFWELSMTKIMLVC